MENDRLVKALKEISLPEGSQKSYKIVRDRVMLQVREEAKSGADLSVIEKLKKHIRKIGRNTTPEPALRMLMKEKIFGFIEKPRFSWDAFLDVLFARKAWAGTLVLAILFSVSYSFFTPQAVFAAPQTYLESFDGEVSIMRRGSLIPAKPNFVLKDQDTIVTSDGSAAVIRFLDDSVGRLAPESELYIERLFVNQLNETNTVVELDLRRGTLWARVLNLVDELSRFQVATYDTVSVVKKRAAFNVTVEDKGKTTVQAVDNIVEVKVKESKNQKKFETTITDGYSVEVENNIVEVKEKLKEAAVDKKDVAWIEKNLEEDKEYVNVVRERDKEKRQKQAPSAVETTSVFKSKAQKQVVRMKAAEVKLVQAELLLDQGHADEAQKLLDEFDKLILDVSTVLESLEADNPEKVAAVKEDIERTLKRYKKQFSLFAPNTTLYELRATIDRSVAQLGDTPGEKLGRRLETAGEKLADVKDFAEEGRQEEVIQLLIEYKDTVDDVNQKKEELAVTMKKDDAFEKVLEKNLEHIKLLTLISEEVKFVQPPVIRPGKQRGIDINELLVSAAEASLETPDAAVAVDSLIEDIEDLTINGKKVVEVVRSGNEVKLESLVVRDSKVPVKIVKETEVDSDLPVVKEESVEAVPGVDDIFLKSKEDADGFSGVTVITIKARSAKPAKEEDSVSQE